MVAWMIVIYGCNLKAESSLIQRMELGFEGDQDAQVGRTDPPSRLHHFHAHG